MFRLFLGLQVCGSEGWRATVGAAPMVGYLIGGLVLGGLSDMIGRKATFLISTGLQVEGAKICHGIRRKE